MGTILVLDVAANEGGALSVLQEYYDQKKTDTQNRYIFCVSQPSLAETDTVRVWRFPWVKRSWLHRLWFEHVTLPRLLKSEPIDEILSLQNTAAFAARCPQTVYLHQPLPFCGVRFSLFRQPKFWVYQHLIAPRIFRSLRLADKVIVQTAWMKEAACKKAGISPDKVVLEAPAITAVPTVTFDPALWDRTFFYPASPYAYKNHELLFAAMENLAEEGITDYTVHLTLTAEQMPSLSRYPRAAKQVVFRGKMPREDVMATYGRTVLLFPSYIETFGLPLLEARFSGAPVLAADCPFAREVLEGYEAAQFFDPFAVSSLVASMRAVLEGGL